MENTRNVKKVSALIGFVTMLLGFCLSFNQVKGYPAHSLVGLYTSEWGFKILCMVFLMVLAVICYFLSIFLLGNKKTDAAGKTLASIGAVANLLSAVMLSMLRVITKHAYTLGITNKIQLVILFVALVFGFIPVLLKDAKKDTEVASK